MSGDDNFSFGDLLHDVLEVCEVVVGCGLEVIHNGVLMTFFLSYRGLLNDVGSPHQLGPKLYLFLLCQFYLHVPSIH